MRIIHTFILIELNIEIFTTVHRISLFILFHVPSFDFILTKFINKY